MRSSTSKKTVVDWMDERLSADPKLRRDVDALVNSIEVEQDLIALREARGLSQRQLARIAGLAQPMIARIESGKVKNLELKTLVRLAAALGARVRIDLEPVKGLARPKGGVVRRQEPTKRLVAAGR